MTYTVKLRGIRTLMKNLIAVICLIILSANGCKNPVSDINPQEDDQQVSTLFGGPQEIAELQTPDLDEASGLVHSRSNSMYFWSHNDSGGDPTLFLLSRDGAEAMRLDFNGAQNVDWEEIAIGPGPDDNLQYLYAGDIGDNNAVRGTYTIYRTPEPDLNVANLPSNLSLESSEYETINYNYEDGARDAEAMFVEPSTKDIYLISKREPSVILYRIPFPQSTTEINTAERVMVLPFTFITAADISPSGNEVLIKNYLNIYHWRKVGTETLEELLSTQPNRLNYSREPQGEAIAWDTDETKYYTLSESNGKDPVVLYSYSRN